MHTQNVNTAAQKSSERWGQNPEKRLACVIAEQKSYLTELCGVWNLQLSQKDEAEEVFNILMAMSKNVYDEGVTDWHCDKPLVSFAVFQPWLQAQAHAVRLYGTTGKAAWEDACKSLKDNMVFAVAMLTQESI
jgi:hypothetical protein